MSDSNSRQIEVRDKNEIQRAHDLLLHIIVSTDGTFFPRHDAMHYALDALCWVLHHDHNDVFGNNLEALEDSLLQHGIVLEDNGELRTLEEEEAERAMKETVQ